MNCPYIWLFCVSPKFINARSRLGQVAELQQRYNISTKGKPRNYNRDTKIRTSDRLGDQIGS